MTTANAKGSEFIPVPVTDPSGRGRWNFTVGDGRLALIAGPCSLESLDLGLEIATTMWDLCKALSISYIFKASFDKANRTSLSGYRGPGLEQGLEELRTIGERVGVPVLTDIHEAWQADVAAKAVDVLQIPAFLCRQTDLLVAAARTGKPMNVKKAQFLAPWDMANVVEKCRSGGSSSVMLCERGTTMGYGQLVVDMRSLPVLRSFGCPVVFDGTHSVQMPGAAGSSSGGDRRFVQPLVRAAVAVGVDALFLETHPHPERAKSDGPNLVPLRAMRPLLEQVMALHETAGRLGASRLDWAEEEER